MLSMLPFNVPTTSLVDVQTMIVSAITALIIAVPTMLISYGKKTEQINQMEKQFTTEQGRLRDELEDKVDQQQFLEFKVQLFARLDDMNKMLRDIQNFNTRRVG